MKGKHKINIIVILFILSACSNSLTDNSSNSVFSETGYIGIVGASRLAIGTSNLVSYGEAKSTSSDKPQVLFRIEADGTIIPVEYQDSNGNTIDPPTILEATSVGVDWMVLTYKSVNVNTNTGDIVIIANRSSGQFWSVPNVLVQKNGNKYFKSAGTSTYFYGRAGDSYDEGIFEIDVSSDLVALRRNISNDVISSQRSSNSLPVFAVNKKGVLVYRSESRFRIVDASGTIYSSPISYARFYFSGLDKEIYLVTNSEDGLGVNIQQLRVDAGSATLTDYASIDKDVTFLEGETIFERDGSIIFVDFTVATEFYRDEFNSSTDSLQYASDFSNGADPPVKTSVRCGDRIVWLNSSELITFDISTFSFQNFSFPTGYEFTSIAGLEYGVTFTGLRYSDGAIVTGIYDFENQDVTIESENNDVYIVELIPLE